jgi:putative SOS response-associated peptidase YedK
MHGYPSPSKLDQYRKLKEKALKGKLGAESTHGCKYEAEGRNCAVGALFTTAQLNDIEERGMNAYGVGGLACYVGKKNLEAVTGFTLRELAEMQCMHDRAPNQLQTAPESSWFVAWLDRQIAQEEANAT